MLSGHELVFALAVVLVGATVMGLVGFGLGMVISPALLLILEPQAVVIAINSLSIPMLSLVLYQTRTSIEVRAVTPLAIGGVAAVPVGVLILSSASPTILRITIGAIILALVVPLGLNIQRPLPRFPAVSPAFGFLGSMLVTGLGVGAPLVVLFLVNQRWSAHSIRSGIALYYLAVGSFATVLYIATGLYTLERLWSVLTVAPVALLGMGLGSALVRRLDDRLLRRVVLGVVVVASLALLAREISRI